MGHKDKDKDQHGQGRDWTKPETSDPSRSQWNDRSQREMEQGDRTKPQQPDGTTPLERDQRPINQSR